MREKDFQTNFGKWLKFNKMLGVFELKVSKGSSIPFSALEPHQEEALFNAEFEHIYYKIPDSGYQNPFDCFLLKGIPANVVVMFNVPKNKKEFIMISILKWKYIKQNSKRKSLTEVKAKEMGTIHYLN